MKTAQGNVQGFATVVGKDGDTVRNGNSPTFGFSWLRKPFGEANQITQGHGPRAPGDVVLDEKTASKSGYRLGDAVPIVFLTGTPEKFTLVGVFRFGDSESSAGATRVGFTPRTAQRVVGRDGRVGLDLRRPRSRASRRPRSRRASGKTIARHRRTRRSSRSSPASSSPTRAPTT